MAFFSSEVTRPQTFYSQIVKRLAELHGLVTSHTNVNRFFSLGFTHFISVAPFRMCFFFLWLEVPLATATRAVSRQRGRHNGNTRWQRTWRSLDGRHVTVVQLHKLLNKVNNARRVRKTASLPNLSQIFTFYALFMIIIMVVNCHKLKTSEVTSTWWIFDFFKSKICYTTLRNQDKSFWPKLAK